MLAGYLAHGTATDYMYERLKVPLSFTWEIYGDSKADFHDCFRMFNPLERGEVTHSALLFDRPVSGLCANKGRAAPAEPGPIAVAT